MTDATKLVARAFETAMVEAADHITALQERVKELESVHRSAISLLSENRPDAAHAAYTILWRAREKSNADG